MILVRSPLRITLGGGGSDLPAYSRQHGGFSLVAAIDAYVYVSVMKPFEPGIFLKYSRQEHVAAVDAVQHPIIREALDLLKVQAQIEITTLADVPAGTGLGSSSSFTTALVKALALFEHRNGMQPEELAEAACEIEITRLGAPIGKQDQYAAAWGGLTSLQFHRTGAVTALPLKLSADTIAQLEDGLLLYFTGYSRNANDLLSAQNVAADAMIRELDHAKAATMVCKAALMGGDLRTFGASLHEHWKRKRERVAGMTNERIDAWYHRAREYGAIGGKLVGAGGGGCLLFYTEDPRRLRAGLKDSGLQEIRFRFDYEGTKTLICA